MTLLDRVAQLRAAGREVWSLCAGEPSQGAPRPVREAATRALNSGMPMGYSASFGLQELRAELAAHYRRWYDIDVDPAQIAITTGASGAFLAIFLAAFDAGDRVAVARPGYPAYRNILGSLGCEVVELDCGPEQGYQPTVEQLAATHAEQPLSGLVLASPANPTGTMIDAESLALLAAWCRDNKVRLISDEIYHGITFTGSVGECAWTYDRAATVISSFSKYWGMTGWRLGWALVPEDLVTNVDAVLGNYALCAPVLAQHAALAAFTDQSYDECEAAVGEFARARDVALGLLDELGWLDVAPADGAFYLYASIEPVLGKYADSREWCFALLDETGVAITPGLDFDSVAGAHTVRVSLAAGAKTVEEALRKVIAWQQEQAGTR